MTPRPTRMDGRHLRGVERGPATPPRVITWTFLGLILALGAIVGAAISAALGR